MDNSYYATLIALFVMEQVGVREAYESEGFNRLHSLILRTADEFASQTAGRDWTRGKGLNECIHDIALDLGKYYAVTSDDTILMMVQDNI